MEVKTGHEMEAFCAIFLFYVSCSHCPCLVLSFLHAQMILSSTCFYIIFIKRSLMFLPYPQLLSLLILRPPQLVTQCTHSGRLLWLYLAVNRCNALERNTLPLLASSCACLCLWLFLYTSSPVMLCWLWLSNMAQENWVRTDPYASGSMWV